MISSLSFANTDLSLGSVDVGGDLTLTAGAAINQTGQWDVDNGLALSLGSTGTIDVDGFANEFASSITLSAPAGSDVLLRNALPTASVPTLPASLNNLTIIFDQAAVELPALGLTGDLSIVSAGSIQQQGAWDVDGTTPARANRGRRCSAVGPSQRPYRNGYSGRASRHR